MERRIFRGLKRGPAVLVSCGIGIAAAASCTQQTAGGSGSTVSNAGMSTAAGTGGASMSGGASSSGGSSSGGFVASGGAFASPSGGTSGAAPTGGGAANAGSAGHPMAGMSSAGQMQGGGGMGPTSQGGNSNASGSGGTANPPGGGGPANGGSTGGGAPSSVGFDSPSQAPQGSSSDRYYKTDVTRNGANYFFMANGWGPGFQSQTVSWNGTSFTVESMQGMQGKNYEPASYPTVFCGVYSDSKSKACGLPKAISDIKSLRTGWRWQANGNNGQYNAAYDIWLGNGSTIQTHSSFLMVWLRDPPGQQPAGMRKVQSISVSNVPGNWDIWAGTVGGIPCVSYTRAEGQDSAELEFDVMDFVRDVGMRGISVPGSTILSVAIGFEMWNGPITNLATQDFYVSVE